MVPFSLLLAHVEVGKIPEASTILGVKQQQLGLAFGWVTLLATRFFTSGKQATEPFFLVSSVLQSIA